MHVERGKAARLQVAELREGQKRRRSGHPANQEESLPCWQLEKNEQTLLRVAYHWRRETVKSNTDISM